MAMQRAQRETENQFEYVSGYQCIHCMHILDAKRDDDKTGHLLDCIQYIKKKHPNIFETMKRYDVSIQADTGYAGKLVVQNELEEETMQGIKEILSGVYFEERHSVKLNIIEATV